MTICDKCPCCNSDFEEGSSCNLGGGNPDNYWGGLNLDTFPEPTGTIYWSEDKYCPLDHIQLKDGTIFRPEVAE